MAVTSPEDRSKLHIAVLDPVFRRDDQPGSTRTYDLARRLVQAGHRVSILTTTAALPEGAAPDSPELTWSATPLRVRARFGHPVPSYVGETFASRAAWRLWQLKRVDAVLMLDRPLGLLPAAILFCAVRGIPLLLEAREGLPPPAPAGTPFGQRLARRFARGLFRVGAAFAKKIIVLSPDTQDALAAEGLRGEKILLTAPGCDTGLFANKPSAGTPALSGALSAYPYLSQGILAVYAGGMNAERGLEYLIEVAGAVQSAAPEITFALCGDGPLRGTLEARAQALGVLNKTVWFLDPLPRRDLPALLNAAAVVIVGARKGGDAGAFDALAAARPAILIRAGWQRELIEGRGAGMALPANDVAAAAREVIDYMKDGDGLRRAGQQAAALAVGRFNIDRIVRDVRGVIEDAVAADPRQAVMRRRMLRTKRVFDVAASLLGLIVLSPVFLILAVAIAAKMGTPVFFTQARTGLKGKLFNIVKFRTMTDARDSAGNLLPDAQRLTAFGKFLRRTSLDELPELINVLKGDMSLVGPRPLLPEYLPYYAPEQRRRHDVVPGLTGWSQVNGRNALTWEDKFALDTWYVDNASLGLDFKILLKTVWIALTGAFTGQGVSAEGHATMPRFDEIMARRQGAEDV